MLAIAFFVSSCAGERAADRVEVARVRHDIQHIALSVERFYLENNSLPTEAQGLDVLVENKRYLDRLPLDPWGNHYAYRLSADGGSFDVRSLGPDGRSSGDDIGAEYPIFEVEPIDDKLSFVSVFGILIVVLIGLVLYFVPTFVAFSRNHKNRVPILVLNVFLGGTVIGWVGALVWALLRDDKESGSS